MGERSDKNACPYILACVRDVISAVHVIVQENMLSLVVMAINFSEIKHGTYFYVYMNHVGLLLLESSNEKTFSTVT